MGPAMHSKEYGIKRRGMVLNVRRVDDRYTLTNVIDYPPYRTGSKSHAKLVAKNVFDGRNRDEPINPYEDAQVVELITRAYELPGFNVLFESKYIALRTGDVARLFHVDVLQESYLMIYRGDSNLHKLVAGVERYFVDLPGIGANDAYRYPEHFVFSDTETEAWEQFIRDMKAEAYEHKHNYEVCVSLADQARKKCT